MAGETAVYSQSNLEETRQPMVISVSIALIVLSTIAIILRLISRRIANIPWHRDDILVVLGWIFYIGFTGGTIADVKYSGLGLHQARGDAISLEQWAKFLYGLSFIYVICVLFPRLAILSLYFALFSIHRWSSIICYATGIIMIGNCLACISALFAICRPMNALWNGGIAEHCFSINDLFRYGRIVNIITDVVLLVLPLIHVYRLQMKTRMKLGVLATFILGSIGLLAAILSLSQISTTNAVADNTWSGALILIWATMEVGAYQITACVISYVPLAKYLRGWFRRHHGATASDQNLHDTEARTLTSESLNTKLSRRDFRSEESCVDYELTVGMETPNARNSDQASPVDSTSGGHAGLELPTRRG